MCCSEEGAFFAFGCCFFHLFIGCYSMHCYPECFVFGYSVWKSSVLVRYLKVTDQPWMLSHQKCSSLHTEDFLSLTQLCELQYSVQSFSHLFQKCCCYQREDLVTLTYLCCFCNSDTFPACFCPFALHLTAAATLASFLSHSFLYNFGCHTLDYH